MRQRALWLFIALLAATTAAQGYIDKRDASAQAGTPIPFKDFDGMFGAPLFSGPLDPFAQMRELEKRLDFQEKTVESGKEVVVELTIPGLDKDSLNINVDKDGIRLTYDAKTRQDKKDARGREYFKSETVQHFERVMPIPEEADGRKSRIARDGDVVKIIFPKKPEDDFKADA